MLIVEGRCENFEAGGRLEKNFKLELAGGLAGTVGTISVVATCYFLPLPNPT